MNVPATATLALTFDEPVAAASVTSRTFAVHGSQGPRLTGIYDLSNLDRTVIFDPERKFFPGERVDASVTTGTQNITGTNALSSTVWQFWAAAEGGSARFIDSGNPSPAPIWPRQRLGRFRWRRRFGRFPFRCV